VTEFSFYQLLTTPLEAALPKLLERVHGLGLRAVVVAGSEQRVDRLNDLLWTYNPDSFLPHGSARDGNAEHQPIWLTHRDENPNSATVLVLTDGASIDAAGRYARCLDIFDGTDPLALAAARLRYKAAKDAGHEMRYFRQTEQGWEQG
jgi:DNA polymerase-3 subunit chi